MCFIMASSTSGTPLSANKRKRGELQLLADTTNTPTSKRVALHLILGGLKKSASSTLSLGRAYIYAEIELRVDRVAHIFMLKDTLTEKANSPDDIESITR